MRVLICGSRHWLAEEPIGQFLATLDPKLDTIITGGARGADTIAHNLAKAQGFATLVFPAQWDKYGNRAGPIRNQQMLTEGKPELVVAFTPDLRYSKGTNHMVSIARRAGVKTVIINK